MREYCLIVILMVDGELKMHCKISTKLCSITVEENSSGWNSSPGLCEEDSLSSHQRCFLSSCTDWFTRIHGTFESFLGLG